MKTEYNKFSKKTVDEPSDAPVRSEKQKSEISRPETWTATRPVNFRTYAGLDAMVLKIIDAGEKVKANGQTAVADGEVWLNVSSEGMNGYVMKKYFVR